MPTTTVTGPAPVVTPTKSKKLAAAKANKSKLDKNGNPTPPKGKRVAANNPPAAAKTTSAKGKGTKIIDEKALKAEIVELLNDLKTSTDADEKKNTRRKLRIRGFYVSEHHEPDKK